MYHCFFSNIVELGLFSAAVQCQQNTAAVFLAGSSYKKEYICNKKSFWLGTSSLDHRALWANIVAKKLKVIDNCNLQLLKKNLLFNDQIASCNIQTLFSHRCHNQHFDFPRIEILAHSLLLLAGLPSCRTTLIRTDHKANILKLLN